MIKKRSAGSLILILFCVFICQGCQRKVEDLRDDATIMSESNNEIDASMSQNQADEGISDNQVSENIVSDNTVSEDTVSEDTVSEDIIPENSTFTISEDNIRYKGMNIEPHDVFVMFFTFDTPPVLLITAPDETEYEVDTAMDIYNGDGEYNSWTGPSFAMIAIPAMEGEYSIDIISEDTTFEDFNYRIMETDFSDLVWE